jgi:hypothetical protein
MPYQNAAIGTLENLPNPKVAFPMVVAQSEAFFMLIWMDHKYTRGILYIGQFFICTIFLYILDIFIFNFKFVIKVEKLFKIFLFAPKVDTNVGEEVSLML